MGRIEREKGPAIKEGSAIINETLRKIKQLRDPRLKEPVPNEEVDLKLQEEIGEFFREGPIRW